MFQQQQNQLTVVAFERRYGSLDVGVELLYVHAGINRPRTRGSQRHALRGSPGGTHQ
jgi:hypothetical protein